MHSEALHLPSITTRPMVFSGVISEDRLQNDTQASTFDACLRYSPTKETFTMNATETTSRIGHFQLRRVRLAFGVLAIVGGGILADAGAVYKNTTMPGSSTCEICLDVPEETPCTSQNSDFSGRCGSGEDAACAGDSIETFTLTCKASLGIIQ